MLHWRLAKSEGGRSMNDFEKAALYALSQLDEVDINHALYHMDRERLPLEMVSSLSSQIYDCMEEYGDDNDLPEGWWLDYGDESDVFTTALDLKADEK